MIPIKLESAYDDNAKFLDNNVLGIKVDKSFKPEDLELWKSIDWKSRNYEEYPVEDDSFVGKITIYGEGKPRTETMEFCKYIRPNPIYPPYYGPVEDVRGYVGPMYDGNTYNGYDIHDRYETQETYDMLSR